jgi:hypothetical protein
LVTVALPVLCFSSFTSLAKDVRHFDTYSEALSTLLDLNESPNGEDDAPKDRQVSCLLFGDPAPTDKIDQNAELESQFDQLAPALQRHCNETRANSNSGAALGGGFGSSLSTRTVSQFDEDIGATDQSNTNTTGDNRFNFGGGLELTLDDDRTFYSGDGSTIYEASNPDGRQSLSEQSPTGTVRWSSDSTAVFFTYEHEEIERKATEFQDGLKSDSDRFTGGATIRLSESFAVGASGFYGEGDGEYEGAGALFSGAGTAEDFPLTFEQICGIKRGGRSPRIWWVALRRLHESGQLVRHQ